MSDNIYGLFQAYGVEMEYMIVQKDSLDVYPIADKLIYDVLHEYLSDVERGKIAWSNELVNHVIEIKCNGPAENLIDLDKEFHKNILEINDILSKYNACLMGTGAHPWMNPYQETELWSHEYNEIYDLYNQIFNCRGHGWSNLQSTHINLPFSNDDEFYKLHTAIRVILPVLPTLTASTPVLDGRHHGFMDHRLEYYRSNQHQIPQLTGWVIPESVKNKKDYYDIIFDPIIQAIRPFDPENILDHHFLNSRGAIARFDRMAIEIRTVDIQESPKVDIAIVAFVSEWLKSLINGEWAELDAMAKVPHQQLYQIFLKHIHTAEKTIIEDEEYLRLFCINSKQIQSSDLILIIFEKIKHKMHDDHVAVISKILEDGPLSRRILNFLNGNFDKNSLQKLYRIFTETLIKNSYFDGKDQRD